MHIKGFAKWFSFSILHIYTFLFIRLQPFNVKFNMLVGSNAGPPDPLAKAVRKQFDEEIQRDS